MKNLIVVGGCDRFAGDTAPTLRSSRLRAVIATSDVASERRGLIRSGVAPVGPAPSFDSHPGLDSLRTP